MIPADVTDGRGGVNREVHHHPSRIPGDPFDGVNRAVHPCASHAGLTEVNREVHSCYVQTCTTTSLKRFMKRLSKEYDTMEESTNQVLQKEGLAKAIGIEAGINAKPRIRMTQLYLLAQTLDYLVIGTGNLCEAMVGYTTKWGDNSSDFNPIGNFTVDEVLAIGKYLGVPEKILQKAPNDGLGGKTDEEKMGIQYSQIAEMIETGETEEDAKKEILKRYNASKHKRELVPVYTFERKNYLKDLGEKNKSIL